MESENVARNDWRGLVRVFLRGALCRSLRRGLLTLSAQELQWVCERANVSPFNENGRIRTVNTFSEVELLDIDKNLTRAERIIDKTRGRLKI